MFIFMVAVRVRLGLLGGASSLVEVLVGVEEKFWRLQSIPTCCMSLMRKLSPRRETGHCEVSKKEECKGLGRLSRGGWEEGITVNRDGTDGASTSARAGTGYYPPSSIGDSTWRTLRTAGDDRGSGRNSGGLSQFSRYV
ncbi:hypothetical protein F5887DRAFT_48570 [Amanita rubescens]|nr:hypothetical protein F5887DRAFT_48570 [Amanita rubescens]